MVCKDFILLSWGFLGFCLKFYHYFTSIINIQSLLGGLAAQAHTVERVPCLAVEREFARLGVEGADGGCFAAAADEAHGDALGQVVGGGCAGQAACRGRG